MLGPGLRAAQVVLLGVCALLVYAILAPHLDAAPPLRDVQHADVAAAPDAVGLGHYASIWKRSPFRMPEKVTADLPKPKALKVATVSKLSWEVVATAAASSPEFSVAGLVNAKSGERRMTGPKFNREFLRGIGKVAKW